MFYFAKNLKKTLKSENKTLIGLSKATGIPYANLSRMSCGKQQNPTLLNLHKIAHSLGVSLDFLIYSDPENPEEGQFSVKHSYRLPIISMNDSLKLLEKGLKAINTQNTNYIDTSRQYTHTAFATKADFNSIDGRISEGDLLIFSPEDTYKNGDIVLISENNNPVAKKLLLDGNESYASSLVINNNYKKISDDTFPVAKLIELRCIFE